MIPQIKILVPALVLVPPLAAGRTGQSPPIRYSVQAATTQLALAMKNASAKPIAAYVLRMVYRDENGNTSIIENYSAITRGLGLAKGRPSYQPGEQWSDLVKTAPGEPAEVQLDLVLFEDGTHWGPNKSNRLERLLGMRDGARLQH